MTTTNHNNQQSPSLAVRGVSLQHGEDGSYQTEESFEQSLGEIGESNEHELKSVVEIRSFVSQLRKELLASGFDGAESDLDRALELLATDLRQSDLYFKYLEATDTKEAPPDSLAQDLQDNIAALKVTIEMYERELREWDEVCKKKREELEALKKDRESEREVDFLSLPAEDSEALQSYLSPEQKALLDQGAGFEPGLVTLSAEQLERICSAQDRELERIQGYCQTVNAKLSSERHNMSTAEETPRTLFKALKNHDIV